MTTIDWSFYYALLAGLDERAETRSYEAIGRIKALDLRRQITSTGKATFPEGLLADATILQVLSDLACRQHHRHVRLVADELLAQAAARRGWRREQLENALAPDLGLGEARFDYGARRFALVAGDHQRPLLRGGRRAHTSPPRARSGDNRAMAREAAAQWKAWRPLAAWTLRAQAARLERAMVEGSRWAAEDFVAMLGHPLLGELARRVIWAGYGADGAPGVALCLADGHSPLGEDYAPVAIGDYPSFGIPHPATATPEQRQRWGGLLNDFHVAPLFPQAARQVFTPAPVEREHQVVTRFAGARLRRGAVEGWLGGRGWQLLDQEALAPPYEQAYNVCFFERAQVMAVLDVEHEADHQRLAGCRFAPAAEPDELAIPSPLPLGAVDAVAYSEALWRLAELSQHPTLGLS